jgi:hypothetical protein
MRKSEQVEPGSGTESSTDSDGNERKRELIFLLSTIQQKMTSLNVDNTKEWQYRTSGSGDFLETIEYDL